MEMTDEQLEQIKNWDARDLDGLMAFIKPYWKYAEDGYWIEEDGQYRISTAGWSDNEEIIGCMMSNHILWMMNWYSSERGGHYIFEAYN